MRLIFCFAALPALQALSFSAFGATPVPYDQVIRADFTNQGGPSSAWLFPDRTLHCAHSAGCRKANDTIRVPRGFYACGIVLNGFWPGYRLDSAMTLLVNVARGRRGFDYYADPYGANWPTRLETRLILRPNGSSPAGCMKEYTVFDCRDFECRPAQPGGIADQWWPPKTQ